jgi:predicted pyridoxine 5'-phosphate oxidase superfamily flavin-nucleotide-binding protein
MAKRFDTLTTKHIDFIRAQQMFFVGTAAADGMVNVSPKGLESLKVLAPDKIIWLNYVGSGNETAAHLESVNRMTLMFCSFAEKPLIMRVFGTATTIYEDDARFTEMVTHFPKSHGARQVFVLDISLVLTSCGFGVPRYDFVEQRPMMQQWLDNKTPEALSQYQQDNNAVSLDGKPIRLGVNKTL